MSNLAITEVDSDEVRRALIAYRTFNQNRARKIVMKHLQELITCDACLQESLEPGDNPEEIRDQFREILERMKLGV